MIPATLSPEEFVYTPLSAAQILDYIKEFKELLEDFARTVNLEGNSELECNQVVLAHICKRIDQRKDYYMYYHSVKGHVMYMSHEKEMGLWAYWVTKYKPVRFKDQLHDQLFFGRNGCTISDAFAAYLMISTVCENNHNRVDYFSDAKVEDLFYDLSNRDFSKEAIISRIEDLIA